MPTEYKLKGGSGGMVDTLVLETNGSYAVQVQISPLPPISPFVGISRQNGLKIRCLKKRVGASPIRATKKNN